MACWLVGFNHDDNYQLDFTAETFNLKDEAENLLIAAKRYDLLNKFYQNTDQWNKALEVSNKFDRIHLRNTCYNYAKFCEERSELTRAIEL